jgi:hypothetical protein
MPAIAAAIMTPMLGDELELDEDGPGEEIETTDVAVEVE